MIQHNLERLLPFSHKDLYSLITNVESYNAFIPWCKRCIITERFEDGSLKAEMMVGFEGLTARYNSYVTCHPYTRVHVLGEGDLFEHLEVLWFLSSLGEKMTKISFNLQFSFKSNMLQTLAGGAFDRVTDKIMDAFETYARQSFLSKSL